MKITVIGCGNGAFATAADLSYKGHEITLYVSKDHRHNFIDIMKDNIINCTGVGPNGSIKIKKITCDLGEAMSDYDLIMPVTPSYAQDEIAHYLAPYLNNGDKIILSPGSTGGSLVFAKIFHSVRPDLKVKIAEIHTLPYTARKTNSTSVNISLMTGVMYFAAFPAIFNEEMLEVAQILYPTVTLVEDVLESSMNNGNATTHPAPVVLNAGKIEYYGKHYHYKEGITPSVGRVVQMIDDERKLICRAFGYKEIDIKDRLALMGYTPRGNTVYECIQGSKEIFLPLEGPNDLNGRYLAEDAPLSLLAMASVGHASGVATPLMDSVVFLASALKNEDYWKTGRTLEKMGLDNKNIEEIKEFLKYGYTKEE